MVRRVYSLLVVAVAVAGIAAACELSGPSRFPLGPSPGATPVPTVAPAASGSVAIDPSLRAHLPEFVDGLPLLPAPEADAEVARVPEVVANAEALVTALAIDPAGEFAHVQLIRLRPAVFSDPFFRSWRDSFDEGFCDQAGGVRGRAEASIGDRQTFITTCGGGARAYHTWLPESRILVAVSSVGERRLGEQVLEGLSG